MRKKNKIKTQLLEKYFHEFFENVDLEIRLCSESGTNGKINHDGYFCIASINRSNIKNTIGQIRFNGDETKIEDFTTTIGISYFEINFIYPTYPLFGDGNKNFEKFLIERKLGYKIDETH